jgi:ribonuclease HI
LIEVFVDGAAGGNPGIAGGGIYINLGDGREIRRTVHLGVLSSNHEAEFATMVAALKFCHEHGYLSAFFRTDSQLVDHAIEIRHVKNSIFAGYLEQAMDLIQHFDLFFCKWIPDEKNRNADQLARQAIREQRIQLSEGDQI